MPAFRPAEETARSAGPSLRNLPATRYLEVIENEAATRLDLVPMLRGLLGRATK
jgi:hypothetical protein